MIKVLCASHIRDSKQITAIFQLLDSLEKQTLIPEKILISISFSSSELQKTFEQIEIEKRKVCTIESKIFYSDVKKSQFEHYKQLFEFINNEDIIFFADDDDLYCENRIELMSSYFTENINIVRSGTIIMSYKDEKERKCLYDDYVDMKLKDYIQKYRVNAERNTEFWNCAVRGSFLKGLILDDSLIKTIFTILFLVVF